MLGQVANPFQDAFGIHRPVFLAELDLEHLIPHLAHTYRYDPVPEFPVVTRDMSVLLDEHVEFIDLANIVCHASGLVKATNIVETYRGEGIAPGKKSMTFSVTLAASDRTLTSEDVDAAVATISRELVLKFDGVMRG